MAMIKIGPHRFSPELGWHISRIGGKGNWEYLHKDGTWKGFAADVEAGTFTGYYKSQEEAEAHARKFGYTDIEVKATA